MIDAMNSDENAKAASHFGWGYRYEISGNWDNALIEYKEAAEICNIFDAPLMTALICAYQARVLRNKGEMKQALGYIKQANELLIRINNEDRTSLYVSSETESIWGTIYLKMPLSQDRLNAHIHFKRAIHALEKLLINIERNESFVNTSILLVNLVDLLALWRETTHNICVNKINLVELSLHEKDAQPLAENIADDVIRSAVTLKDTKLLGAGFRIKGEIALLKEDYDLAILLFKKSLSNYRKNRSINPEVITAVTTKLLHAQTLKGLLNYEQLGSPRRLKWFDKIPRPIVFLHNPFLFNIDSHADKMPAEQAQQLYLDAAIHWAGADWQDRCYKYLVKAIECVDIVRTNQLIGGEFHAHRRTEYFAKRTLLPFHYMLMLLLSPKFNRRTGIADPIAEAFYYREKCGAIGLLDELKTGEKILLASVNRNGRQQEFKQIEQFDLLYRRQELRNHNNFVRAFEDKRAEKIKELIDPNLGELLNGQALRLEEVQKFLPNNSVLIEYVLTEQLFAIFVITHNSVTVPVFESDELRNQNPQIHLKEISKRVKDFLYAISHELNDADKPTGLPVEHNVDAIKEQAQWLYDALLRPTESYWLKNKSASVDRLIIVPQGILHQMPFSTLFNGAQFVAELIPTIQIPSASILQHYYAKRLQSPLKISYFGIANPSSEAGLKGCEDAVLVALRQLGFNINAWNGNHMADEANLFLAVRYQMATKSVWLENAPYYDIVDLETHGRFTGDSPLNHGFLLADDNEDGETWFTANDIFLNLRMRAELLVAAMCYSGKVKVFLGDELSGLVRAFIYAGCRSILMYPWALVDKVAMEFMQTFYYHLIKLDDTGAPQIASPKDKALQMAQVHIINSGRQGKKIESLDEVSWEHPYYWGWILIGDYI